MSVEAPERIWVWPATIDEMGSSVNRDEINGDVEYVRADKLEELAAEIERLKRRLELTQDTDSKMKLLLKQEDQIIQYEAALAEAKRENEALREACNQSRLAFAGMVSVQSAIDKLDTLPRNVGGKDGE